MLEWLRLGPKHQSSVMQCPSWTRRQNTYLKRCLGSWVCGIGPILLSACPSPNLCCVLGGLPFKCLRNRQAIRCNRWINKSRYVNSINRWCPIRYNQQAWSEEASVRACHRAELWGSTSTTRLWEMTVTSYLCADLRRPFASIYIYIYRLRNHMTLQWLTHVIYILSIVSHQRIFTNWFDWSFTKLHFRTYIQYLGSHCDQVLTGSGEASWLPCRWCWDFALVACSLEGPPVGPSCG